LPNTNEEMHTWLLLLLCPLKTVDDMTGSLPDYFINRKHKNMFSIGCISIQLSSPEYLCQQTAHFFWTQVQSSTALAILRQRRRKTLKLHLSLLKSTGLRAETSWSIRTGQ